LKINVRVNHEWQTFHVEAEEYLLDTLRRYGYLSVRRGCDSTSCGVCTIIMDQKIVPSCSVLSVHADQHDVLTVEGIPEEAAKISDCFGNEGADQCGFCNPSLALTIYQMKRDLDHPTIDEVKHYLLGNLCRCTGYIAQEKAIMRYLEDES
jgi:carbon-monoxide dehydrogenase small subunit